jgi:hypothetical protein
VGHQGGRRQRFFQLSADLTTLRWAWDRYVLLFHAEGVRADCGTLVLRLEMGAERDVVLRCQVRPGQGGRRVTGGQLPGVAGRGMTM